MPFIAQNTYKTGFDAGYVGMVANGETSNRISRTVEDAAGIAFGKAAFRGADDRGCTATPTAGKFMGIAIADIGVVPSLDNTNADVYPQYSTAGLLNEGVIFVQPSVTVAAGDQAYVTSAGAFTNVSSTNTLIPAKFDEAGTTAAPSRLRVTRS
jgi:hypothetical protein